MNLLRLLRGLVLAGLCLAGPAVAQADAVIPPLSSPVVDTTGTLDAAQVQRCRHRPWPCSSARAASCRS